MIDILLHGIAGGFFWRLRGGLGNEFVRKLLGKPAEWEIPNTIICGLWGMYIAAIMPITWATPLLALVVAATAKIGYLKQVAEYFGFPSGFNLELQENRQWRNYFLLSARGMLILLPAYLCFYQLYPALLGGVLMGAFMPICYLIGVEIRKHSDIMGASQYAEFLIGSSIVWGIL